MLAHARDLSAENRICQRLDPTGHQYAYRTDEKHWQEYPDVIGGGLEEGVPLSEAAFPAALLFSRRALKSRGTGSGGHNG
jgi:hypothetical protein